MLSENTAEIFDKIDWNILVASATDIEWNTYVALIVGAGITYFFTTHREKKRQKNARKDFKKILCSQFRELQLRLALLCYSEMVETNSIGQKNLTRLCETLADIDDNEDVNKWRELAQKDNAELTKIFRSTDEQAMPRDLNSVRVPALEMGIASLELLETDHQEHVFSLMTKFSWLNEQIEQYRYSFRVGLGPTRDVQDIFVVETHKALRLATANQIAGLTMNILENMTELLKELSEDT